MKINNIYINLLLIVFLLLLLNCNVEDKQKDANLLDKSKDFFEKNKNTVYLILVLVVLYGLYYLYVNTNYLNWFKNYLNKYYNNDYDYEYDDEDNKLNKKINVVEEVKPNVSLYYADWCPHCNSLKPIWNKFYESNKNNPNFDIKVVDCTESCPNPDVEGYPTILVTDKKGEVHDFSGDIKTEKDIEKYVLSKIQ